MTKTIRLALALLACFIAAPAVAVEVGWIDSIDGSVPGVKLVRQGKTEAAKPYSPVQTDDLIQLPDEKTSVVVTYSDGKTQRIAFRQSPFRIESRGAAPSVPGNLLKWVSGLIAGDSQSPQRLTAMTARGGAPLSVPYLAKRFFVVAQQRALYFSWSDGSAPFHLRLIRLSDHKEIVSLGEIKTRAITTPVVDLAAGDYQLEVADASGSVYEDQLRAVPAAPVFPESLQALPPASAKLVAASWLARAESGLWVIEAMQQLKELSTTDSTAKAVLKQLEQGAALNEH
ncbi:MAG: hypothetical protein H6Q35_2512 [Proteobacteria bacterium]|nr:hypothetical protein [Pseudomonadota bacterium]MBS1230932.1 hypothetical protein [Pseudomonadota bacterium]